MKIMLETTQWSTPTPNHVYVMNNSMTKMIAYVPAGTRKVFKFKKPMGIDTRGRTFVDLDDVGPIEPDPQVITVEGSRGEKYFLSNPGEGWVCTCPGFKFRASCKHLATISLDNN